MEHEEVDKADGICAVEQEDKDELDEEVLELKANMQHKSRDKMVL